MDEEEHCDGGESVEGHVGDDGGGESAGALGEPAEAQGEDKERDWGGPLGGVEGGEEEGSEDVGGPVDAGRQGFVGEWVEAALAFGIDGEGGQPAEEDAAEEEFLGDGGGVDGGLFLHGVEDRVGVGHPDGDERVHDGVDDGEQEQDEEEAGAGVAAPVAELDESEVVEADAGGGPGDGGDEDDGEQVDEGREPEDDGRRGFALTLGDGFDEVAEGDGDEELGEDVDADGGEQGGGGPGATGGDGAVVE